jgi:hypothetical protein
LAVAVPPGRTQKRILIVRVDFPDLAGEPHSGLYTASYVQQVADGEIGPYYERSSYGQLTMAFTIAPQVYRMPRTAADYATNGAYSQLHYDVQSAVATDYAFGDYDKVMVLFSSVSSIPGSRIGWDGLAEVGGKRHG